MNLQEQRTLMRSGAMYNDLTPELIAARQKAILSVNRYNQSFGEPQEVRENLLRDLFQKVGTGVHFEPNLRCEFGFNVVTGDRFYANFDCILLDGGGIEFGDDVLLGPRVGIYTSNHAIDAAERAAGGCYAKPVKIGSRVWIGAGVHIMQGVTIGDSSIIGAGSIVTQDIPANVVAAGVPCRVIREITESDRTGFAAGI